MVKSYNGFSPAQRMRALNWLKGEYAAGRRAKAVECDCCGQTKGIIEHHSEDYSEPFGDHIGAWSLCFICHMMIHCRYRNPRAWTRYKESIADGFTFEPFYNRNWDAFRRRFLESEFMADGMGDKRVDRLSEIG